MRHPMEKITLIELISLGIVVIVGLFSMIQGYLVLLFLTLYVFSLSLMCDALIQWNTTGNTLDAGKQALRSLIIFIFTTYLFFQL
ncbi:hypothetical protein [Oceanobacillus halophilus]|uniref:DUF4181 domain-containing protein n=1 Tax=Oceanobacillus halophilus TaxID=930130 RepID=A0A494ZZK0_9BACI|nr:hypothetical protein [Oceanobacillus halophilus]RKQ31531.1 hypothetical protein D8M06_13645 [Oceanobacillus halophilus]